MLSDKENAVIIGTAIDELIRHHPNLKAPVFEAMKSMLGRIEELGNTYNVSKDLRHWYHLQSTTPPADAEAAMDVDEGDASASKEGSAVPDLHGDDDLQDEEDSSKIHDNLIVQYIDVLGRVRIKDLTPYRRC